MTSAERELAGIMMKKAGEPKEIETVICRLAEIIGINDEVSNNTFVVTNTEAVHGFWKILDKDVQKEAREICEGDCYVIPSSINEAILIPDYLVREIRDIERIIREVNEEELDENEILSDRLYILKENGIYYADDDDCEDTPEGEMAVMVKEPGKSWELRVIDGSLKSMQEIVGGLIEVGACLGSGDVVICNEDGIHLGLTPQTVVLEKKPRTFFGTVFVCGTSGENFTSPSFVERVVVEE